MTDMGAPPEMVDTMASAAQEGFDTAIESGMEPMEAFDAAGESVDAAFGDGPPPEGDMGPPPEGDMGPPPEGDMEPPPEGDMGPPREKVDPHQETWQDQDLMDQWDLLQEIWDQDLTDQWDHHREKVDPHQETWQDQDLMDNGTASRRYGTRT